MFKQNLTFLIILISYTLFFSSLVQVNSFPTEFKADTDSDIEFLQEALRLNMNEVDKLRYSNKTSNAAKRKRVTSDAPNIVNRRVLTVNKGMNIAGNIKSESIKVSDLNIVGKVDVSSLLTSTNISTKKVSTDNLSVEKIVSTDVN